MLVYKNNESVEQYRVGLQVETLKKSGDVVVIIDPSKTNMACLIGSPCNEVYSVIEFSGNGRGQDKPMDTTVYCNEVISYLDAYLTNVTLYDVGIEKAISKKGMEHHHSSMVLTEIRGVLLNYFMAKHGFQTRQMEINNFAWKSGVLPDGYRGHSEKGSKRFIRERFPDSPFCNFYEADATDALCMYWYRIKDYKDRYEIVCNCEEEPVDKIPRIAIQPEHMDSIPNMRKFRYNKHFSVKQNAIYYRNRLGQDGITPVSVDDLTIEEIYEYASGFYSLKDYKEVRLLVC